jgi:CheY-like chemotaxis protein/HPt (histidine-containing phosphotransfer) domain-containing protein
MIECDGRARLKLDVVDTGIGISAEQQKTIFDPFVQADSSITRQYGGTGLGLAISRSIAQALGGELTVTGRLGAGSTFSAVIDAENPPVNSTIDIDQNAPAGLAADPSAASLASRRILVVEDNPFNRKLIKLSLERLDAEIELAENGQAGVEQALAGAFDLILMDMQMPVMDGHTAVKLLREKNYRQPIVALTAHALDEERDKCLAAGCTDFLTKPIDMDHLAAVVGRLLAKPRPAAPQGAHRERGSTSCEADEADHFALIAREYAASLIEVANRARRAAAERDLSCLAEIGHNLKGSGGTFGFAELTEIGGRLEKFGARQEFAQVAKVLDELSNVVERLTPDAGVH